MKPKTPNGRPDFVVPFGKYNGRQEPGATAMQFLLKDD